MSQPDKAQLAESYEKKRRKNKRWKKLVLETIDRASRDRVHGEIVLTLFDGEVRGISKNVKIKNPDEELARLELSKPDTV